MSDRALRASGKGRTRATKALRLLREPAYWRALTKGVAASVENVSVDFRLDVATVLDVGASRGQFAAFALPRFPLAQIICFEPLAQARAKLVSWAPEDRVTVHSVALGKKPGERHLHVSAHDDSSSLLPIGKRQAEAFPGTGQKGTEKVNVDVLAAYLGPELARPILLKIDVQGFELEVIGGAGGALATVDEVYVECSFVELYTGQSLVDTVICRMRDEGFRLAGVYGIVRARNGTCLQGDMLFRRTKSADAQAGVPHE